MTRDSRANLIFAIVLVVLIAPGAYILLNKKLRGPSDPNYMPDPLQASAAYNQPPPVPPGLPRIEPPEVRLWVGNLLQDRIRPGVGVMRDSTGKGPVVSDSFRTQLLHLSKPADGKASIWFMIWNDRFPVAPADPLVLVFSNEGRRQAGALSYEWIDVPDRIRKALQHVGYVDPPAKVCLVHADYAASSESDRPDRIEFVSSDANGATTTETIELGPK